MAYRSQMQQGLLVRHGDHQHIKGHNLGYWYGERRNEKYHMSKRVNITLTPHIVSKYTCRNKRLEAVPRLSSAFPARNSNYINNIQSFQRVKSAAYQSLENNNDPIAHYHCVQFPITDPVIRRQGTEVTKWWQLLASDDKQILKVQTFSPFATTAPLAVEHKAKRFKSKQFNDGVHGKMFIDQTKIIYFKNSRPPTGLVPGFKGTNVLKDNINRLQESTERQITIRERKAYDEKAKNMLNYYHTQTACRTRSQHDEEMSKSVHLKTARLRGLLSGPKENVADVGDGYGDSFIQTHSKAKFHDKSFYLRTPVARQSNTGQGNSGATPCCKCHWCLYERELGMTETMDSEQGIINSITSQLKKRVPIGIDNITPLSCPPSRPNSVVNAEDGHIHVFQ